MKFFLNFVIFFVIFANVSAEKRVPFVINTWNFKNATIKAWDVINRKGKSAVSLKIKAQVFQKNISLLPYKIDLRCCRGMFYL